MSMSTNAVGVVLKIAAAIVVVAGLIFVAIAYGDKIAAWCKKLLGRLPFGNDGGVTDDDFDPEDTTTVVAVDGDFEG